MQKGLGLSTVFLWWACTAVGVVVNMYRNLCTIYMHVWGDSNIHHDLSGLPTKHSQHGMSLWCTKQSIQQPCELPYELKPCEHTHVTLLTWWTVASCHHKLPLFERVDGQPYGITRTLGKVPWLLLPMTAGEDSSPGTSLVFTHKRTTFWVILCHWTTSRKPSVVQQISLPSMLLTNGCNRVMHCCTGTLFPGFFLSSLTKAPSSELYCDTEPRVISQPACEKTNPFWLWTSWAQQGHEQCAAVVNSSPSTSLILTHKSTSLWVILGHRVTGCKPSVSKQAYHQNNLLSVDVGKNSREVAIGSSTSPQTGIAASDSVLHKCTTLWIKLQH